MAEPVLINPSALWAAMEKDRKELVQEALAAVTLLNDELGEHFLKIDPKVDREPWPELNTLSNGRVLIVTYAEETIWSSEDDDREWNAEETGKTVDLVTHLREKMRERAEMHAQVLHALRPAS